MKRAWIFALLLAGCHGPSAAPEAAPEEKAEPVTVELADVVARNMQDVLPVDGNLVLPEGAATKLAPAVAGKLVEILVKEGDRVVAGQVLARVDTRALVAQSQSAAAGAASANASAVQSDLALQAARVDQASSVEAARLALEVAIADGKAGVDQAAVDLQKLRAGARPQEIAQAQQAVDQARIARDKAKRDADRDALLLKEGLVAGAQADASKAALQTADSALHSAQSALDLVRAGNRPEDIRAAELRLASAKELASKKVDQARAALRQAEGGRLGVGAKAQEAAAAHLAAQQKQADARAANALASAGDITSPISGYVVKRLQNPGDVADPANPVLWIAASRPTVDFTGNVTPSEAERIRPGMPVSVDKAGGTLTAIGQADPATGLIPIRARLSGNLVTGGFAKAQIVLANLRNVPTVPKGAILSREGKSVVFVEKDGTAHQVEVELGPVQNGFVAIRKGLTTGQRVVVLGSHELSDGAKIEAEKGP